MQNRLSNVLSIDSIIIRNVRSWSKDSEETRHIKEESAIKYLVFFITCCNTKNCCSTFCCYDQENNRTYRSKSK